jgi:hypothetical protein
MAFDGRLQGLLCGSLDVRNKGPCVLRLNCPLDGWLNDIALIWDAQKTFKLSKH